VPALAQGVGAKYAVDGLLEKLATLLPQANPTKMLPIRRHAPETWEKKNNMASKQ
jgi:hypothetical protein